LTAAVGFYQKMGLALPSSPTTTPETILIWGASSSVGVYAVQLAKLSGYNVIGVCSKKNFDYIKSLKADHVVDYNDAKVLEQIKKLAPNLRLAYDCIGTASANSCLQALAPATAAKPAQLAFIAGAPDIKTPEHVTVHNVFVGAAFSKPDELKHVRSYYLEFAPLLESGKLVPNQVHQQAGGLGKIVDGLKLLAANKVSAGKLVYTISTDP